MSSIGEVRARVVNGIEHADRSLRFGARASEAIVGAGTVAARVAESVDEVRAEMAGLADRLEALGSELAALDDVASGELVRAINRLGLAKDEATYAMNNFSAAGEGSNNEHAHIAIASEGAAAVSLDEAASGLLSMIDRTREAREALAVTARWMREAAGSGPDEALNAVRGLSEQLAASLADAELAHDGALVRADWWLSTL